MTASDRLPLRVLMPQRFDLLGRAMDSNITTQWLALGEHCDVVFWSPGLRGFDGRSLDRAVRDNDCDLVLLPDFHHAIPGMWEPVIEGIERCGAPTAWYLGDPDSALAERRAFFHRVRPAAVVINCGYDVYHALNDLVEELGCRIVGVPLGYDTALFHPPAAGAGRDLDVLLAGADTPVEVYPLRRRLKDVVRALAEAGRLRCHDQGHPGYWETVQRGPVGRGQASYADLLRRSRLVVTGTAFGGLPRKYWEGAACGAVGIGDLPDHVGAVELAPGMLRVDVDERDDAIAARILALLDDPTGLDALSAAAIAGVARADHSTRARAIAEGLAAVAGSERPRRPRVVPAPPRFHGVVAAPDPRLAPTPRTDWHSVWDHGVDGASRTRRTEAALQASDADVVVIAFDPDAALPTDGLVLAEQVRARGGGGVVVRPGRGDGIGLGGRGMAAVAVDRETMLAALADERGRAGVERAVFAIAARDGLLLLENAAFEHPLAAILRLDAAFDRPVPGEPSPAIAILGAAVQEVVLRCPDEVGHEVCGWVAGRTRLPVAGAPGPGDGVDGARGEDPELHEKHLRGARFVAVDPGDATTVAAVVTLALTGTAPIEIAVPYAAGCTPEAVVEPILAAFAARGADPEAGAEMVVLERPLWAAEVAWLAARAAVVGAVAA
jgi:hypothetical protein